MSRKATVTRNTLETRVTIQLDLDGSGRFDVETGIGFFDHMLGAWARHGRFDLQLHCQGDLQVDPHHTVEDVGLALGQALAESLGERAGIQRFGEALTPMDEALVLVAVDLSGRPHLTYSLPTLAAAVGARLGSFDVELAREFFHALAVGGRLTLHLHQLAGGANLHHLAEAAFKGCGRAMGQAVRPDPRLAGEVPSTKGVL